MKLLFCPKCACVKGLQALGASTTCDCGDVVARYTDDVEAEWNGNGFLLGFANGSFVNAIRSQHFAGDLPSGLGREFTAFVIPRLTSSVKIK